MALGLPAALVRFYFDYQDDPATLRRYVGTITLFGLVSGLVGSLLLTLFGPAIFGWLLPNTPFHPFVLITIGIRASPWCRCWPLQLRVWPASRRNTSSASAWSISA